MSETIDARFFDFSFQVLNYAIEFIKTPGYSSLRFTDVLEKTVNLALQLEGIENKTFYEALKEKFKDRRVMSDPKTREELLNELLTMFIEEWRKQS
jgi:hypothetical protein